MLLDIAATRRRAARWRDHDAKVPFAITAARGRAMSDVTLTTDTTGKAVRQDGAYRGRRISWPEFAELTGRPIPAGARLRAATPPRRVAPRPAPVFWLGRKCRFPKRYSDPTRENRGNPRRPAVQAASKPMAALLRPLSAKDTARTAIAHIAAPVPPVRHAAAMRLPLAEEHTAGRLSARHVNAADWFERELHADDAPQPLAPASGGIVVDSTRDPLALFPIEAAADAAIRVRHRFRSLGGLARVVVKALEGAEMRDLAPAWAIPQRALAEAGRIRLRAALELCARMAEREVDKLPLWETLEVARAACAECSKLEAKRKLRADNDNVPMRIAA